MCLKTLEIPFDLSGTMYRFVGFGTKILPQTNAKHIAVQWIVMWLYNRICTHVYFTKTSPINKI